MNVYSFCLAMMFGCVAGSQERAPIETRARLVQLIVGETYVHRNEAETMVVVCTGVVNSPETFQGTTFLNPENKISLPGVQVSCQKPF